MSWPCRIATGCALVLAVLVAQPVAAQENIIESISIAEESAGRISVDVVYRYSGDHGKDVFVSVVMAQDGTTSPYYGYRPGAVRPGHNRTRVELGTNDRAPEILFSSELLVSMYAGGGEPFVTRRFSFAKTWRKPGASLPPKPVLAIVPGDLVLLPATGNAELVATEGSPGSDDGGIPERRVLPNGHVVLTYADGTVRERFAGGEKVTRPDGTVQTYLYQNAQPPTAPTPPDSATAAWLEAQNARLLDIMRTLVGYDEGSIENYLAQEGPSLSLYQRIEARSGAIGWLVAP